MKIQERGAVNSESKVQLYQKELNQKNTFYGKVTKGDPTVAKVVLYALAVIFSFGCIGIYDAVMYTTLDAAKEILIAKKDVYKLFVRILINPAVGFEVSKEAFSVSGDPESVKEALSLYEQNGIDGLLDFIKQNTLSKESLFSILKSVCNEKFSLIKSLDEREVPILLASILEMLTREDRETVSLQSVYQSFPIIRPACRKIESAIKALHENLMESNTEYKSLIDSYSSVKEIDLIRLFFKNIDQAGNRVSDTLITAIEEQQPPSIGFFKVKVKEFLEGKKQYKKEVNQQTTLNAAIKRDIVNAVNHSEIPNAETQRDKLNAVRSFHDQEDQRVAGAPAKLKAVAVAALVGGVALTVVSSVWNYFSSAENSSLNLPFMGHPVLDQFTAVQADYAEACAGSAVNSASCLTAAAALNHFDEFALLEAGEELQESMLGGATSWWSGISGFFGF